ncbi:MAG TPA: hypothetical protein VLT87_00900 [Thermoanaerobaculia bacterium]|nr:hypothetical protein [Thermoanaerobaculia bacterium]
MDDSERSYGYSEDIYHGTRKDEERSYEYGPEGGLEENVELSPEEAAVHIEGNTSEEVTPDPNAGQYDYGREGTATESFTWDLEASPKPEAKAADEEKSGEREEATAAKTGE